MHHDIAAHRPRISISSPWRRRLLCCLGAVAAALLAPAAPASAQTSADSTVTLVWTAPGDDGNIGTANRYDLRYRTTPISGTDTLTWWNAATPVTGLPTPRAAGSTDSMRVRGLTPVTTYYFLLKAADEVPNWSGYSNVAVKTTSGDLTAPSVIADLAVTGATGTTLSLRWTAPGDDGNVGTATSYDIRYSTSPITNANFASATAVTGEPVPAVAGTVQTMTIAGLSGSTTYYIAMKTTDNASNVSGLSNVPTGTTTDTVAPAAVRDLSYDADGEPMDLRLASETATAEIADAR
jgi:hypothetical protein